MSARHLPKVAARVEDTLRYERIDEGVSVSRIDGIDLLTDGGHPLDGNRVWRSQERADGCDGAEQRDRQQQRHDEPVESGTRRGPFEPAKPPTPTVERDGLPGDLGSIERSRGEGSPSPEAFLQPRFEVDPVSHR